MSAHEDPAHDEGPSEDKTGGRLVFTTCNRWDSNWVVARVGDATAEQELLLSPRYLADSHEEIDAALGDEDFEFVAFDADGRGFTLFRAEGRTTASTGPRGGSRTVEMDSEETVLAVLSLYRATAIALFADIEGDRRRRLDVDAGRDAPVPADIGPVVR